MLGSGGPETGRRSIRAHLLLVLGIALAFPGRPRAHAQDAPDSPAAASRATLIVFAREPSQLDAYLGLASPGVAVAYRPPSPDPAALDAFDRAGRSYFFTAASSDYPNYEGAPLYVDPAVVAAVAPRPGCRGLYLHEVLTFEAARNAWNWSAALDAFDWTWMDRVMSYGRPVIWSEPSYAWPALDESPLAARFFERWGPWLVPMFATNFPFQIESAREHARAVASRYGMAFGESHQGWYFHDAGGEPTRQGSRDLARLGWDRGATYFQFEGTPMDLYWDSPYMLGVRDFAAFLASPAAGRRERP